MWIGAGQSTEATSCRACSADSEPSVAKRTFTVACPTAHAQAAQVLMDPKKPVVRRGPTKSDQTSRAMWSPCSYHGHRVFGPYRERRRGGHRHARSTTRTRRVCTHRRIGLRLDRGAADAQPGPDRIGHGYAHADGI